MTSIESKLVDTLNNTTIGSYEKHISTNINYLEQLRKACQESCNYDDPDMNAQIKGMMKTKTDEEWLSICRTFDNCEHYHQLFTETRALFLQVNKICAQPDLLLANQNQADILENDDVVNNTISKINKMTVPEFKKKLSEITSRSRKSKIESKDRLKFQVYSSHMHKLHGKIKLLWDAYVKEHTPVTVHDKIKMLLKDKFKDSPTVLQSGFTNTQTKDSDLYEVKGELISNPIIANIKTGEIIELEPPNLFKLSGGKGRKRLTRGIYRGRMKHMHSRKKIFLRKSKKSRRRSCF
jgi:hypothetical protein